jgi:hypothetical protein
MNARKLPAAAETGPDRPRTLADRPLKDQPLVQRPPERGRDAYKQSSVCGFVPPWNRSFSTETGDEQPRVWRIMRETLGDRHNLAQTPNSCRERTAYGRAARPAGFPFRHATSAAAPASSVGFSPAPFLRNLATDQLGSCPSITDQLAHYLGSKGCLSVRLRKQ